MFGKEGEMRPEESKLSTVIAKGTKILGNIEMEGSLRVDGYIKGKVTSSETLTVGKTGEVEGEVEVKEAVIGGKFKGNLIASGKVELENRASILGDVKTRIFVIKEGGVFHGKCSMQEEPSAVEQKLSKGKEPALKFETKQESPEATSSPTKPSGSVASLTKPQG